jgi:site-specific DNA-methyltransferase (adenine-specific)
MIKTNQLKLKHGDGLSFLGELKTKSINLVLTDPPYIISKDSGMQKFHDKVKSGENLTKTTDDWKKYKIKHDINNDNKKEEYLKYGTIYGKKYAVKTDYGSWDKDFDMNKLKEFVDEYYRVLVNGGTCIIFFDLWKITLLHDIMVNAGFKQMRMIEWIKTNPQPRNSKVNYLTNCREIALLGIKKSKPTFNSKYDNGIYKYPLQGGKIRIHPTQKSLPLFEELIRKHSNEDDIVLDTFLGAGTTAMACMNTKRICYGCELEKKYFDTYLDFQLY